MRSSHGAAVTPTVLLQGSHAQEYGAMRISRELSSDFEGSHAALAAAAARGPDDTAVLQHDADLVHLRHRIATGDPESAAAAERELQAELRERSRIDRAVLAATGAVLKQHLPAGQITSLRSMPGATCPRLALLAFWIRGFLTEGLGFPVKYMYACANMPRSSVAPIADAEVTALHVGMIDATGACCRGCATGGGDG